MSARGPKEDEASIATDFGVPPQDTVEPAKPVEPTSLAANANVVEAGQETRPGAQRWQAAQVTSLPPPKPSQPSQPSQPSLWEAPLLDVAALRAAGTPVEECGYLALGAGIGSFLWTMLLRHHALPSEAIRVVGESETPFAQLEASFVGAGTPLDERWLAGPGAILDHPWRGPGYGWRELWLATRGLHVPLAMRLGWRLLQGSYHPRIDDVLLSIHQESVRIGWSRMRRAGVPRALRKTKDGRYGVLVEAPDGRGSIAFLAAYVCVALEGEGESEAQATSGVHPFYQDLAVRYQLPLRSQGQLAISPEAECRAMAQDAGAVFVLESSPPQNDDTKSRSLQSLQAAALASVQALVRAGAPGLAPRRGVALWLDKARWWWGLQA